MIRTADGPLPVVGARPRLVLAVLLVERNRVVPSDRLAEELWGDEQPADAAAAVRTNVFRLRKQLGVHAGDLDTVEGGYVLRVDGEDLDAGRFEADLAAALAEADADPAVGADRLGAALSLWRGRALGEFADRAFAQPEARRLEELRGRAVEARGDALLKAGRAADALVELESFVAAEPERERARALLMEALYRAGRQTDALDVYRTWCAELGERGLEPSPELRRLEGDILRHALAPAASPPASAPSPAPSPDPPPTPAAASAATPAPTRLSVPVTTFIGRAEDVTAVVDLLDRARIVTIVGPGGVGKTRLSLHVAAEAADRFPDGVVVCDLAPVTDQAGVWRALAQPLGVEEATGTSLDERIAEVLADQRVLVVVDNCEQVVEPAAALIDTLVRRTGHICVLATSRERLAVDGEHLWPVAPLATQGADAPAVHLFVDRARAADPRLPDDLATRPAVAEIVRRLDGLPLAIELAAARCATLSVEDVAAALEDRFGLLTGGIRTTPRHRSLAAVVEWSYDLLDDEERRVFEDLSVFAGRFDLEDALAVAGADKPVPADAVLRLAERSLLMRHDGAPTRFSMLESLREFGRRRLAERVGVDEVSRRHAEHFVTVAARAGDLLQSPEEAGGVAFVAVHLDELRAAQAWLRAHDPARGLALVAQLRFYALFRISSEVYAWTEAMVGTGVDTADLPLALGSAAQGAWFRGDFTRARTLAQAGVEAAGSRRVLARQALETQGDIALLDGALEDAAVRYHEAAEQFLAAGEPTGAVAAIAGGEALALAYQGDIDAGAALVRQSLDLAESIGVPTALAFAHYGMAEVATCAGDTAAAEHHARAALELAAPVDSRFALGIAGVTLATLLSRSGRVAEACARYRDVVEVFHRSGTWAPQWVALRTVVDLLERAGNPSGAAVLFGALTASRTAAPAYGADAELLHSTRARLDGVLGPEEAARLVAQGAALTDDAAIGHAIRALDAVLAEGS
ncbi:MAG: BTAD domain-containing putative transcriptional regulator [Actinomycetota bacterium]|jgi:predicted ATPase/DNA-binding SARP family transcriptional activator